MRNTALGDATLSDLLERFVRLCIEQDRQMLRGDVPRVNSLFDDIEDIEQELKMRPGDQRRALAPLYEHENMHVRLKAAKATLAIAPEAARKALEDIKASGWMPQAAEASGSLWTLDRGIFKPS